MQTGAGEVAQQATVHAPKPDNLSLGPVQYMVGKQPRSSPDAHLHSVAGAFTHIQWQMEQKSNAISNEPEIGF